MLLERVLPCDVKQIDYLEGLTDMYNLQWTSDPKSKTVYFEPYNDFFGSGKLLDWTEKLDHSSWNDKFIVNELAKRIVFRYTRDSGDVGHEWIDTWRENNGHSEYTTHIEIQNQKFRKEEIVLGTDKFASSIRFNNKGQQPTPSTNSQGYNWGDMSWQDPVTRKRNPLMPIYWSEEGGDRNKGSGSRPPYQKFPRKMKMRILNYYDLLNGELPNFVNTAANIMMV